MAGFLSQLEVEGQSRYYVSQLLQIFAERPPAMAVDPAPAKSLSKAEIRTLGLLAKGLSNREIAAQAFVSVNSVNTHLKNIYAKLGVDH